VLFLILLAPFIANGVCMLVAPRAWFRISKEFGIQGGMTKERYGHSLGLIQVRSLGVIFVGVAAWIVYDALSR
jgi:hypothetical protein